MLYSERNFQKILLSILLLAAAGWPAFARADITPANCGHFYELIVENMKDISPAAKRREDRYVTEVNDANKFFLKLRARFGPLPLRDTPREGYTNVTITNYPRRFALPPSQNGTERVATFRFRKYGERPQGTTEGYEYTGSSKTTTKVEFKIDDPDFERSKLKPGITMNDADIELMLKDRDTFIKNYAGIRERTLAIPEQDTALAEKMLITVQRIYDEAAKPGHLGEFPEGLRPQFQIEYERSAFEVKFKDKKTGENIRAQFTIDKNIKSRTPNDGKLMTSYENDLRVIEVKLPVNYLQLTEAELKERSPELADIMQMASEIPLAEGFRRNAGKFGGLQMRQLKALREGDGVSTEDLIEDLLANASENVAASTIEGSKAETFRRMAARPMADYLQSGHHEVRRLGQTAVKRPRLSPSDLQKLTSDIQLYNDLVIDQLIRKKARNALDPTGEEFLSIVQGLKVFQRTKTSAWAAQRIEEKFSLLAAGSRRGSLSFQDLFDSIVDDYVAETGKLKALSKAERWDNFKEKFRPHNIQKTRRLATEFIKDRAAKTYAGHILVFPASVGAALAYANICAHFQWNCPLLTQDPEVKENKVWTSKRAKFLERKQAVEMVIDGIQKQITDGESPVKIYSSTQKKLKDEGKQMRTRLQGIAQKNSKLKNILTSQLSEWHSVFTTAKQNLHFAVSANDQEQITAAREEYATALATMLNAEIFMPSLVASPLTDEDRSLKNVGDAGAFQKKTLELLKAYKETLEKVQKQMDTAGEPVSTK